MMIRALAQNIEGIHTSSDQNNKESDSRKIPVNDS